MCLVDFQFSTFIFIYARDEIYSWARIIHTEEEKLFNEISTLQNSCLNYIAAAHSCSLAVGNWHENWKFSQFFFERKSCIVFWEKAGGMWLFPSDLSVAPSWEAATGDAASRRYFLQNQRHENWRKYEVYDGVRPTACFQKLQSYSIHVNRGDRKTLESQKNISERNIFCNYSRRFPFGWEFISSFDKNNSNDADVITTAEKHSSRFIFHKAWKSILIFQFVMRLGGEVSRDNGGKTLTVQ